MKFVLLVGQSSSGKDSLLNEVLKVSNVNKIVSYTTRPMRANEVDGEDYHFITKEEFLNKDDIFECKTYKTNDGVWYYGVGCSCLREDIVNIGVVDINGLTEFIYEFGEENIDIFYIYASSHTRLLRSLNREGVKLTDSQCYEICRRYIADDNDMNIEKIKDIKNVICLSNEDEEDFENNVEIIVDTIESRLVESWLKSQ